MKCLNVGYQMFFNISNLGFVESLEAFQALLWDMHYFLNTKIFRYHKITFLDFLIEDC